MQESQEEFIPQPALRLWWERFTGFVRSNYSVIAALMLSAGLISVALGPLRALADMLAEARSETAVDAPESIAFSVAAESGGPGSGVAIERAIAPYTIVPDRPRNEPFEYTVQPGDTLIGIAERFNLDPTTVVWANAERLLGDVHMLRNGMDLYILPEDGVYHRSDETKTIAQIASKYSVEVEAILDSPFNDLDDATPDTIPPWGMRIVVPGGVGEAADLWRPVIVETADPVTGGVVRSFMPGMSGSCASGIAGRGGTGSWIPPMATYALTQPFYPGHAGVDLANVLGTPVVAADGGVVIFSGWVNADWGYGVLVVLDHGNGWTTYYAHLSATYVGCGSYVARGATLGAMGSTGNSTGPHLHFEMRWFHTPDNPAAYIAL